MNIIEERERENLFFDIGAASILGTREYQQDFACFYTGDQEILAVVCDGMGGLEGGERASSTAVLQIFQDFRQMQPLKNPGDFFVMAAARMNQAVNALKNDKGQRMNAGTTLVAVYMVRNQMYWASVGDSRIYVIRGNQIHPVNRLHNYRLSLQSQLQSGMIDQNTYYQEEKKPQAEALISFIGIEDLRLVDASAHPMEMMRDDIVVLCSDGVYKSLNDSQICALARDNDLDMYIASDRLTSMALRYGMGAQDNTTVIMMKCLRSGQPGEEL